MGTPTESLVKLSAFVCCGGIPFRPAPVPVLGLSQSDKQCIRDRTDSLSCMPSTWVVGGCRVKSSYKICSKPCGVISFNSLNLLRGQSQLMSNQMRSMDMQHLAAMEQTRKLAHTLSQDGNPIFQQYLGPPSWANQFANEQGTDSMLVQIDLLLCLSRIAIISQLKLLLSHGPEQWADEFASGKGQQESAEDKWVNEFSKLNVDDWVDEFAEGPVGGSSADAWGNAYDEFLTERNSEKHASGVYVFSDMNPYAIAAMMRAQEADPSNLEVLLALGVSHTSELEQATALKYLYGWLRSHPKYGTIAPPELADSLYHADMNPEDADVHIVLGVLYNLSREFDRAITSTWCNKPIVSRVLMPYLLINSCASRQNLIQACEARNLDVLQKEFPL
ncbi:hypothetical protein HID58_046183 [Brassica napus]|uniref:Peroxin-5 n=1 Tax=Brassica napus TaxID=3708 RepID=A0ABQ8AVP0_BRANA|nr:hypothetical protein HID58_046183 [Brassica napus]